MGFPPYLIGIGIPLLVGLLGIGLFIFNQERHQPQNHYQYRNYERGRKLSFSEGKICTICLEDMNMSDSTQLNCGHMLHNTCMVELHKRNIKTCPECRADIIF